MFGSVDASTGEWNGIIKEIMDGNVDMSVNGLIASKSRQTVVDFNVGIMEDVLTFIGRKPGQQSFNIWAYVGKANGS